VLPFCRLQVIEQLLHSGERSLINARDMRLSTTPLHTAATTDCSATVLSFLISSGADVNAVNILGQTALMLVSSLSAARVLLEAGATVNTQCVCGATALHMAAERGLSAAVMCCLLKAGADATIVDCTGLNPAATAAQAGHTTAAALLQRAAADPLAKQQQQQQQQQLSVVEVPAVALPVAHVNQLDTAAPVPAVLSAAELLVDDDMLEEGSWQQLDRDTAQRLGMLAQVFKMMISLSGTDNFKLAAVVTALTGSSMQRHTLDCARGLEHKMYLSADSLAAFAEPSTLFAKVLQVCTQMQADAAAAAAAAEAALLWRCTERDAPARALTAAKLQCELQQRTSLLPRGLWELAVPALAQQLEQLAYSAAVSLEMYSACSVDAKVQDLCDVTITGLQGNVAMRAAVEHYELLLEQSLENETDDDDSSCAEDSSSDAQQQQQREQAAVAAVAPAVLAAVATPLMTLPATAAAAAQAEAAAEAAAASEAAAAEWALVQSDAPVRQLTLAKAAAVLQRCCLS
jgi:ankyrin repeat protein